MPQTKEFKNLVKSMKRTYLGEQVPKQYQSRYGKVYDPSDVKSFAYAVAKSRGIKIDKRR